MGLESGTYINDLNTANPLGTDAKSAGDDHLRLIKSTVKATFPGMAGAAWRVQAKSANYTVVANDNMSIIRCTAALTLNLTAAATLGNQHMFVVVADGGAVTVDPNGAELINGAATLTVSDGSACFIAGNGSAFFAYFWTKTLAITGTLGATDNALLRADGTGAVTAQGSVASIGDTGDFAISGAGASANLQRTDNGGTGARYIGTNDSSSPAVFDNLVSLEAWGRDSATNLDAFAHFLAQATNVTSGAEAVQWIWQTMVAGTLAARLRLGAGLFTENATGGDKGADTINAQGLYQKGVLQGPIGCRGYVTYSGGTPTLVDSENVTSITDTGTGDLTVTIATDHANANYTVLALGDNTNLASGPGDVVEATGSRLAGAFGIQCHSYNTATLGDPGAINFATLGDL